jgi:hypothetical protein
MRSSRGSKAPQDQKKEGKQLCIDIINEVKEIEGVSGIHVMAYRQEEYVAEIVHESGVLKGRRPWKREPRADDAIVAERLDHNLRDSVEQKQPDGGDRLPIRPLIPMRGHRRHAA